MSNSYKPLVKSKSQLNSRRDFIFKKLFGGFFLFTILPFVRIGNLFSSENKLRSFGDSFSFASLKDAYSIQDSVTHLNTASIGLSPKIVVEEIYSALKDLEKRGRNGDWLLKDTRTVVADFLGTNADSICFTRNATEGINIVADILPLKAGDEIILTEHEHIGGSAPWIKKAKSLGVTIKLIQLDLSGKNNLKIFENNI